MRRVVQASLIGVIMGLVLASFAVPALAQVAADQDPWDAMHQACEAGDWDAMNQAAERAHGGGMMGGRQGNMGGRAGMMGWQ